jgi:hypothetical protein
MIPTMSRSRSGDSLFSSTKFRDISILRKQRVFSKSSINWINQLDIFSDPWLSQNMSGESFISKPSSKPTSKRPSQVKMRLFQNHEVKC